MHDNTTMLSIVGSLCTDSYNRAAIRAAQDLVPTGTTVEIFDLQGILSFNEDDEYTLRGPLPTSRPGCGQRMPPCW
jgi:chromate reductase